MLPLELIVRVFRTYKGDIERGIQGSVQLRNPGSEARHDVKSEPWTFTAKDNSINTFDWSRKLDDADQKPIDLLKDLCHEDGRLEVIVQCLDQAQYYGFAQPDCYIRLPDGSPLWNFVKAQVSIWVQMVLVIAIGVTCSTLVNAPVAMMFTIVVHHARILPAVLRRRGDRQASRRRAARIALPDRDADEPDVAAAGKLRHGLDQERSTSC